MFIDLLKKAAAGNTYYFSINIAVASIAMAVSCGAASKASAQSDYVVTEATLDESQAPKSLGNIANDCKNNQDCRALLNIVETYFEIPPDTIVAVAGAVSETRHSDQDRYILVQLPSGYQYCHSNIAVTNLVPASGGSAPDFTVKRMYIPERNLHGLNTQLILPQQGLGGGGTWIEAKLRVIGVRSDIAEEKFANGECKNPKGNDTILHCRGNPCNAVTD